MIKRALRNLTAASMLHSHDHRRRHLGATGGSSASSLAKDADLESFKRAFVKTMRPSSLIGRFAETKEVANLVVFLCGEGSSAITGASLRVDGGVVRSIL